MPLRIQPPFSLTSTLRASLALGVLVSALASPSAAQGPRTSGATATAASGRTETSLPLSSFLTRLQSALGEQDVASTSDAQSTTLHARVTAESRSGVRRLRIRDFQLLSDSDRGLAGYNLGAGSWETEVGVLGSAVATEFLFQAALAGIALESVDVVFTSHQDAPATPRPAGQIAYPRNLQYTAYLTSPASDTELDALRVKVEQTSAVLNFVSQRQDIAHGKLVYTQSPATPNPDAPPGLRDFLVEKRAALLRRQQGSRATATQDAPGLRAHVRVEGGTGLRHVRVGDDRFQFIHDNPPALAGFDLGPTVEEHQLGVMGTCLTHIFEIQAAQRQVVLDGLELEVEGTLTPRRATEPPRLRDVQYTVHITSPAPQADVDGLRKAVEAICPIYNLLKDPQTITGRIVRGRFEDAPPDRTTAAR